MTRYLLLLPLIACAPPDSSAMFMNLDVRVVDDEAAAASEFVAVVESAEKNLIVALPKGQDTFLTDAIIDRHESGVKVRVVVDVDQQNDAGVQDLLTAEVPLRLADGAVEYFDFAQNGVVSWQSQQVIMSHAFAVADRLRIVNATSVGGTSSGAQVVFQMRGEDLAEDLWLEHNQLFGGSDATALTAFSSPAKSRADFRWIYPNNSDTPMEFWIGPQERVIKRVIDAIYTARTSVRVMSNELVNDGIVQALQNKAKWGFEVDVVVGPDFGTTSSALARELRNETPDVNKFTFDAADDLPTVILIDVEGGLTTQPRAYIVSHDLYSASRFLGSRSLTTDQLIDGNLTILTDANYRLDKGGDSPLQPLVELFEDHLNRSAGGI